MNPCDHINTELIPLYWDGELSQDEINTVEQHIKTCEDCRFSFDLYREIHDELTLDDIQPPANFHEELVQKLYLQKETGDLNAYQKSFFVKYIRYINVAALFAIIAFIGLSTLNRPMKETMMTATYDTASTVSEEATTSETANMEVAATMEAAIADTTTSSDSSDMPAQAKMMTEETADSTETSDTATTADTAATSDLTMSSDTSNVESINEDAVNSNETTMMLAEDASIDSSGTVGTESIAIESSRIDVQTLPAYVVWIEQHIGLSLIILLTLLGIGVFITYRIRKKL